MAHTLRPSVPSLVNANRAIADLGYAIVVVAAVPVSISHLFAHSPRIHARLCVFPVMTVAAADRTPQYF